MYMEEFEKELFDAVFDKSMSYEELEELFFSMELEEYEENFLDMWLEKENLTYEQGLEQRNHQRDRLIQLGNQFDFPLDNPFISCKKVSELEVFTGDLEEFLSLFLFEQGHLLKPDESLSEKEQLTDYALSCTEYQKIKNSLSVVDSLRQNWMIQKPKLVAKLESDIPNSNVKREELLKVYSSIFGITNATEEFLYNLDVMIGEINRIEAFRKIAPLYVYQVLVKHNKRLQTNKDMAIKQKSLWTYQEYEIYKDNGKNFNKNRLYLNLFERLCTVFQKDTTVNIPLCRWGFMMLSNLVEFQRYELEDKLTSVFPLMDEIIDVSLFSCFSYPYTGAVVLKDTGYSLKQVEYFQTVSAYRIGLEKVAQYMNENAANLLETLEKEEFTNIKKICADILFQCKLKKAEKPNTQRELDLFLCCINLALQDIADYFAKEYLVLGLLNMFRSEV